MMIHVENVRLALHLRGIGLAFCIIRAYSIKNAIFRVIVIDLITFTKTILKHYQFQPFSLMTISIIQPKYPSIKMRYPQYFQILKKAIPPPAQPLENDSQYRQNPTNKSINFQGRYSRFPKRIIFRLRLFEQQIEHMSQIRKRTSSEQAELLPRGGKDSSQDWVCLKCNNLNFSFRNKCNRCKVQSRQDNQQLLYADYYYKQYYGYQAGQYPFAFFGQIVPIEGKLTPQKKFRRSESQLGIVEDDHLPSVSPLIKRYRAGKEKANRKAKNSVFGWKLFEAEPQSQAQLPVINMAAALKELSLTDDEQASQQFTKSVQRMII